MTTIAEKTTDGARAIVHTLAKCSCGSEPLGASRYEGTQHVHRFYCDFCGLQTSGKFDIQEAAKAWNEIVSAPALAKFKSYVHKRLDDAGIPTDPESPHKAEGCRIGGRLDIALAAYRSHDALLAACKEARRLLGYQSGSKPEYEKVWRQVTDAIALVEGPMRPKSAGPCTSTEAEREKFDGENEGDRFQQQ